MSEMQTIYFEDLRVGMRETTRNVVTKEKVAAFAEISGDHNPIHLDEAYAATTPFGGCIAHGERKPRQGRVFLGHSSPLIVRRRAWTIVPRRLNFVYSQTLILS